jgi:hypothetical protein
MAHLVIASSHLPGSLCWSTLLYMYYHSSFDITQPIDVYLHHSISTYFSYIAVVKMVLQAEMWSEIDYQYMTEEREGDLPRRWYGALSIESHKPVLPRIVRQLEKRQAKRSKGGSFKAVLSRCL